MRDVILIPSGTTLWWADELAEMVNAQSSIRAVADHIGVSYDRLWRFFRAQGYVQERGVMRLRDNTDD